MDARGQSEGPTTEGTNRSDAAERVGREKKAKGRRLRILESGLGGRGGSGGGRALRRLPVLHEDRASEQRVRNSCTTGTQQGSGQE